MKATTSNTLRLIVLACVGVPLLAAASGPSCPLPSTVPSRDAAAKEPPREIRYVIHTPRGSTDCLDRVVVRGR